MMNSGVRQMSAGPGSLQQAVNLVLDAAVHDPREFILKLQTPVATRRCHSPLLHHYDRCHPLYKLLGRTANHLRPDHRLRARAHGPTESLPGRQRSTSGFSVSATQDTFLLLADYLKVIVNLSLLMTDTMSC